MGSNPSSTIDGLLLDLAAALTEQKRAALDDASLAMPCHGSNRLRDLSRVRPLPRISSTIMGHRQPTNPHSRSPLRKETARHTRMTSRVEKGPATACDEGVRLQTSPQPTRALDASKQTHGTKRNKRKILSVSDAHHSPPRDMDAPSPALYTITNETDK